MIHVTVPPLHSEAMRLLGLRSDPQSAALMAGLQALDKVTAETRLEEERAHLQHLVDMLEMVDFLMVSDIEDKRRWTERIAMIDRQLAGKGARS